MFNWLVAKKNPIQLYLFTGDALYGVGINRWKSEWKLKTQGGGVSAWLCGSSKSRGVAILLSKHFVCDINFIFF